MPVGRCCSHPGIVSPSLRTDPCHAQTEQTECNYAQSEKWKLYQLTLAAFSSVFIKGNDSLVKDNIRYRVFRRSSPKLNIYENLMGVVDYSWCL